MRNGRLVLFALLLLSGRLSAQSRPVFGNPTNSLEVQIRLANAGDPLDLARVELFKAEMPLPATYANSRGEVKWVNLSDGSYTVRVVLPGYLPGEESTELMGGATRHMIVMLHPDPDAVRGASVSSEDPLVSARFLAAPEKARKELVAAREARGRGDCKSAIGHAKKAAEVAPDFVLAYVEKGMCQLTLAQLDDARQSFDRAIEHDPKFLYGYIGVSNVEAERQRWKEAVDALAQANKVQPDRAEPFYQLAQLQMKTGHLDKAELAAKTAMTKDYSRLPDLPFLLARVYVLEGKKGEAIKCLQEISDKNPQNDIGERARRSLNALGISIDGKGPLK